MRSASAFRHRYQIESPRFELPQKLDKLQGFSMKKYKNGVKAGSAPKLLGWRRRREALGSAVVGSQGEGPHVGERQVAALYDIRNSHQIVLWRRDLDRGRLQARESGNGEQPKMKPKRRSAAPSSTVVADAEKPCEKRMTDYARRSRT